MGWRGTEWINLSQDKDKAILNTVMNIQVWRINLLDEDLLASPRL